ncbi:MAG TPA: hypothetical protein VLQ80_33560 [Candidatus Saccharimonadia bacterium]|jgi:hypothetical protein|nr:hypothetical protein [Candidatus Saccharimonadia bacterium]
MSVYALPHPALRIAAATTDLVQGILTLYPQARILPRTLPLADEDISVEVRLPLPLDAIYAAREQIHTLVLPLQDHYDVLILASVVPLTLCAG